MLSVIEYRKGIIRGKGAVWTDFGSDYPQKIRGYVDIFCLQMLATQSDCLSKSGELSKAAAAEELSHEPSPCPDSSTRMYAYIASPKWQPTQLENATNTTRKQDN